VCLFVHAVCGLGDVVLTLQTIDPNGPAGISLPPRVAAFDVHVDVSPDDHWISGAIAADAVSGARLVYAPDPNRARGLRTVGAHTFVSLPSPDRWQPAPPDRPDLAGGYCPDAPAFVATSARLALAWSEPAGGSMGENDGYVARVAVDLSTVPYARRDLHLFPEGGLPAGAVPLLRMACAPLGGLIARGTAVPGSSFGGNWILAAVTPVTQIDEGAISADVGDLPDGAAKVVSIRALETIAGRLPENDVDLYAIRISDVAAFSATTVGEFGWDSQLFLFDRFGHGLAFNDDAGGVASRVTGTFVPRRGYYMLAISRYDRDPLNAAGLEIWNDEPFAAERSPDGPGAADPRVASWAGETFGPLPYRIRLTGAGHLCPGDLNGDGVGGLEDLTLLLSNFGRVGGVDFFDGDFDGDDDTDIEDLTVLLSRIGRFCD